MSRSLVSIDHTASIFRFAHLSVKEYLETHPDYSGQKPHSLVAQMCITHLVSPQMSQQDGPSTTQTPRTPPHDMESPFQEYTIIYWGRHCRKAGSRREFGELRVLLERFMDVQCEESGFRSWNHHIRNHTLNYDFGGNDYLRSELFHSSSYSSNPLFAVCTYGFLELLSTVLKSSLDIFACMTANGMNCLEISAYHGHFELTKAIYYRALEIPQPEGWANRLLRMTARGSSNINVLDFLLGELPEANIDTQILIAAGKNVRSSAQTMRLLLCKERKLAVADNDIEVIAESCSTSEALEAILSHFRGTITPEAMLRIVIANANCTAEILRSVLQECRNSAITEELVIQFLSSQRYMHDIEMLEILFSHRPHCPLTTRSVQAAAYTSEGVMSYLLRRLGFLSIEEEIVVELMRNGKNGKAILDSLISNFRNIEISEWSLLAACVQPGSGAEKLKTLLNQPQSVDASADLLVLSLDVLNPGVMSVLLELNPESEVTKDVLNAAARYGSVDEMALLMAQPMVVSINVETLEKAVENVNCPVEMTSLLLQHLKSFEPSQTLMLNTVSNTYHGFEIFKLLQDKNASLPVTQNVLQTAMTFCGVNAIDLVEQLFALAPEQEVNEELLLAGAASNLEVMTFLMKRKCHTEISDSLIEAAVPSSRSYRPDSTPETEVLHMLLEARGQQGPVRASMIELAAEKSNEDMMSLLLSYGRPVTISTRAIIAAAGNDSLTGAVMRMLLAVNERTEIPEEAFLKAARNDGYERQGYYLLRMLFTHVPDVFVSEELLVAAVGNERCPRDMVELLLAHASNLVYLRTLS